MVRAINDIGHVMGLQTIAEYVENEAIYAKAESISIDHFQGYAVAATLPFAEFLTHSPVKQQRIVSANKLP